MCRKVAVHLTVAFVFLALACLPWLLFERGVIGRDVVYLTTLPLVIGGAIYCLGTFPEFFNSPALPTMFRSKGGSCLAIFAMGLCYFSVLWKLVIPHPLMFGVALTFFLISASIVLAAVIMSSRAQPAA